MNRYEEILKTYLLQHPLQFSSDDIDSLMEEFYASYAERNTAKDEQIEKWFDRMGEENTAQEWIWELWEAVERRAFLDGMRAGAQLVLELMKR